MKVDSESKNEECKNETIIDEGHQKDEDKKNKFGGGGVYTNEEKTVE